MEWIFLIIILIFSIVLHEVSHGTMAYYLGDPTAKNEGRLTLNPIAHLDFFGSVILPLFFILLNRLSEGGGIIFGWAKPTPINPYNFRDKKYGEAKVAIMGPIANFSLAIVFGLLLRFLPFLSFYQPLLFIFGYIVYINIMLGVFNLLPVPPLDGSHILFTFLPKSMENLKILLHQYGIFILFFILFFLFDVIMYISNSIFQLLAGFPLF